MKAFSKKMVSKNSFQIPNKTKMAPYVFILPAFILLIMFNIYPLISSFYISTLDMKISFDTAKFVGLDVYKRQLCYLGKEKTQDILEVTEKKIFDLVQNRGSEEFVPIRQVVLNAIEKIEKASRTQGSVTGIPTGFIDLDYKMSGFQPSDLILVAARPSMGKTAFVLNIAQYMACLLYTSQS